MLKSGVEDGLAWPLSSLLELRVEKGLVAGFRRRGWTLDRKVPDVHPPASLLVWHILGEETEAQRSIVASQGHRAC